MAITTNIPQIDEVQAAAFLKTYSEVVQKAWNDPAFKAQLVNDPTGTLRAAGVEIPADMEIKLVEHAAGEKEGHTVVTLPLPAAPTEHLNDDELGRLLELGVVPVLHGQFVRLGRLGLLIAAE